jgi:predicted glycogen debranching enzyme
MISYEGLFLATDRADEGRALLRGYAQSLSEGMLANCADTGAVEYNTADATLWFVDAIGRHVAATGDTDLAAELAPAIESLIQAHVDGTRYGIRVDPADSLLTQGAAGLALTWMDARVDGVPVTARRGKAVDINALWINALGTVCEMWRRLGRDEQSFSRRFDETTAAFRDRFPAPHGWLYDVVDVADPPGGDDASLRPNQLLAFSLPYAPMRGQRPPEAVGKALLTPLGLRTLAPDNPRFRPRHRGTPHERDSAYHQGTVWPWLIGPDHDALTASGASGGDLLAGLTAHLGEAGLGSVSETADGEAPHHPTGCPFQAWSVAELTRVRNKEN